MKNKEFIILFTYTRESWHGKIINTIATNIKVLWSFFFIIIMISGYPRESSSKLISNGHCMEKRTKANHVGIHTCIQDLPSTLFYFHFNIEKFSLLPHPPLSHLLLYNTYPQVNFLEQRSLIKPTPLLSLRTYVQGKRKSEDFSRFYWWESERLSSELSKVKTHPILLQRPDHLPLSFHPPKN